MSMVIFATVLLILLVAGSVTKRPLERTTKFARLEEGMGRVQLPRAGRFPVEYLPGPPFAGAQDRSYEFDTDRLLLLSDKAAAEVALERDVRAMIEAGEEKIPPRWRS